MLTRATGRAITLLRGPGRAIRRSDLTDYSPSQNWRSLETFCECEGTGVEIKNGSLFRTANPAHELFTVPYTKVCVGRGPPNCVYCCWFPDSSSSLSCYLNSLPACCCSPTTNCRKKKQLLGLKHIFTFTPKYDTFWLTNLTHILQVISRVIRKRGSHGWSRWCTPHINLILLTSWYRSSKIQTCKD